MSQLYAHGYNEQESARLTDHAGALVRLLHDDTRYPPDSVVLEAAQSWLTGAASCMGRKDARRIVSADTTALPGRGSPRHVYAVSASTEDASRDPSCGGVSGASVDAAADNDQSEKQHHDDQ
jgi:hypothetical protein